MNENKQLLIYNNNLIDFLNKHKNLEKFISTYDNNDYECTICLDDVLETDKNNIYNNNNNYKNLFLKYNHCGIIYIHENQLKVNAYCLFTDKETICIDFLLVVLCISMILRTLVSKELIIVKFVT